MVGNSWPDNIFANIVLISHLFFICPGIFKSHIFFYIVQFIFSQVVSRF